ncbi:hypothetical protein VCRA217O315_170112 [Vibrio crassostreae]|nr:hypothetical protein VCRA217O315_170112 [Vibrio crassostreae]
MKIEQGYIDLLLKLLEDSAVPNVKECLGASRSINCDTISVKSGA